MIIYFSGTGNSAYVAKRIGNELQDEVVNLFDKIRNHEYFDMHSDRPWILVVPTYAWRIPRIVEDWITNTNLLGNKELYVVMTCGDNVGNAQAYLKTLCVAKQMKFKGLFSVCMPENYIAMYSSPSKKEALEIINHAEASISKIAPIVQHKKSYFQQPITIKDKLCSGIVNDIFYPVFVHAKKFYSTDKCIGCGKCVKECPLSNISLVQGIPVWSNQCTHCMACICGCPSEAIEYGKHTIGQLRYMCSK